MVEDLDNILKQELVGGGVSEDKLTNELSSKKNIDLKTEFKDIVESDKISSVHSIAEWIGSKLLKNILKDRKVHRVSVKRMGRSELIEANKTQLEMEKNKMQSVLTNLFAK